MLPLDGDREPQLFLQTPFNEVYAEFSPDERWLAYSSDESGRWEDYVRPFPGPGGKWQISTDGGTYLFWGPDGQELFHRSLEGDRMLVVSYTTEGESFRAGRPRELFQGQFAFGTNPDADIAPDGKRFVMLQSEGAAEADRAHQADLRFELVRRDQSPRPRRQLTGASAMNCWRPAPKLGGPSHFHMSELSGPGPSANGPRVALQAIGDLRYRQQYCAFHAYTLEHR